MAEATSRAECVDRHRDYSIDVGLRLGGAGSLQRRRIEQMVRHVPQGARVLDVGCNSGYIVDFLPSDCKVHGVDVSSALVEKAKARLVSAHVAEAEDLPFEDGAFDVVVIAEVIEHVHDPVLVLNEARRVARRLVVGSTPHEDGQWGPKGSLPGHQFHVRCYTLGALFDDLDLAGFRSRVVSIVHDAKDTPQFYVFEAEV